MLREKALSDALTAAYNRRCLDITMEEELERANRYGRVLSILFVDLNRLQDIKARYGHLSGSKVIQRVAGIWISRHWPSRLGPGSDLFLGIRLGHAAKNGTSFPSTKYQTTS